VQMSDRNDGAFEYSQVLSHWFL